MKIDFTDVWKFGVGYLLESLVFAGLFEALFKINYLWGILFWIIITIIDVIVQTHYIFESIEWGLEKLKLM
jgi:hypothetical protein